jgi:glycosyltransferase involved in cell wall biosynthesis
MLIKKLAWPLVRGMLREAALIHATEPREIAASTSLRLGVPTVLIPHGVDTSIGDKLPNREGARAGFGLDLTRPTLGFLARIHPHKGLDRLLNAWIASGLAERGWQCLVAGDGDVAYIDSLKKLIPKEFAAQVKWVGSVREDRKASVFAACDIFVLPTASENFGMAIAEALACRRPVITTDTTPWQAIQNEDAGRIVRAHSIQELVCAMQELSCLSPEHLARMGERGRAIVSDMTWIDAAKRMIAEYRKIII